MIRKTLLGLYQTVLQLGTNEKCHAKADLTTQDYIWLPTCTWSNSYLVQPPFPIIGRRSPIICIRYFSSDLRLTFKLMSNTFSYLFSVADNKFCMPGWPDPSSIGKGAGMVDYSNPHYIPSLPHCTGWVGMHVKWLANLVIPIWNH